MDMGSSVGGPFFCALCLLCDWEWSIKTPDIIVGLNILQSSFPQAVNQVLLAGNPIVANDIGKVRVGSLESLALGSGIFHLPQMGECGDAYSRKVKDL